MTDVSHNSSPSLDSINGNNGNGSQSILPDNRLTPQATQPKREDRRNSLKAFGFVVLPVAPLQDAKKYPKKNKDGSIARKPDGTPEPLFNGKNPSYLDIKGVPHTVKWKEFENGKQPSDRVESDWFRNPDNGIGVLFNDSNNIYGKDVDVKNFDSQEDCDSYVSNFISEYPEVGCWVEGTQSGGFRIFTILKNKPDFKPFKHKSSTVKLIGELLGTREKDEVVTYDFAVVAPTTGYQDISFPTRLEDIKEFGNAEDLGIIKVKSEKLILPNPSKSDKNVDQQNEEFRDLDITKISLAKLVCNDVSDIINGLVPPGKDNSTPLTTAIKEILGWVNWIQKNYPELLNEDPYILINICATNLGILEKEIRVIESIIDIPSLLPSVHLYGGDDACREKIESLLYTRPKHLVDTTVEEAVLKDYFNDGKEDDLVIGDSFSNYTGKGFWKKKPDVKVKHEVAQILRKCYAVTKKGDILRNFATDRNVKSAVNYCHAALYKEVPENNTKTAFRNCTFDFSTKERLAHSKEDYLTSQINHDYIENVTEPPPIFLNFVDQSYGLEKLELIQAMLGMYIDPTTPYEFFFNLFGSSGSGKGVMADIISALYNKDSVASMQSFQELVTPQRRYQALSGKSLLVFYDLIGYQDAGAGCLNSLVVNEDIAFCPLYSNTPTDEKRNIRVVICSVKPIHVGNLENGIIRRIIPLTTKGSIKEKDFDLKAKLSTEMSQIISWTLSMDRDTRVKVLKNAENLESVKQAKLESILANSSVLEFADYALMPSTTNWISTIKLYGAYKVHCENFGFKAVKEPEFCSKLLSEFPKLYRKSELSTDPETGKRNRKGLPSRIYVELSEAYQLHTDMNKGEIYSIDKDKLINGSLSYLYEFNPEQPLESIKAVEAVELIETVEQPIEPIEKAVINAAVLELTENWKDSVLGGRIISNFDENIKKEVFKKMTTPELRDYWHKCREDFKNSVKVMSAEDEAALEDF